MAGKQDVAKPALAAHKLKIKLANKTKDAPVMAEKPKNFNDPNQERREYIRISKNFILSYFELDRPQHKYEISQLKNISLGGMCFIAIRHFDESTRLGIELKTPYLSGTTYLEGTVLGSHEKMKDKIYETRMKFDPLDTEARVLLEKLINFFTK